LIIAGVDFSHIGLKFGHSYPAVSLLKEAKSHDHRLIEAVCRGDVCGFWEEVRLVRDKNNICGFSAIAVLLELLQPAKGCLLGYDFWQEEATHSAVSFAAMALRREN
jgi:AmmeMemoRadiSam system protein B